MTSPLVFTKDTLQSLVDVPLELQAGETITTLVWKSTSPTTSPALSISNLQSTSTGFTAQLDGGKEDVTYGIEITVTTSLRQFIQVLAVLVKSDLTVPFLERNPAAFQTLVGSIEAGEASLGNAFFVLEGGTDASQGHIEWEVLDQDGTLYSQGNAFSYSIRVSLNSVTVSGQAVINVPSSMVPTLDGQKYQLRWKLLLSGVVNQISSENLTVTGPSVVQLGPTDAVEVAGDVVLLSIVVPRLYNFMDVEILQANTSLVGPSAVSFVRRVSSGFLYEISLDSSQLTASLEPYTVMWKYRDKNPGPVNRETGRLYLLNPSILTAVQDVRQFVAKSRATVMGMDDSMFDTTTIVSWLRRGRDTFNAAGGLITSFSMTNANGGIREFWLMYSEVAMLRAQYLAEGEKTFDFQGASISLNVDKTQFYQSAAETLQSQLDQQVVPFKKTLSIRGVTGGDGSSSAASGFATSFGVVGASYNAMSPAYPTFRPGLR